MLGAVAVAALIAVGVLSGCAGQSEPTTAQVYAARCAACHPVFGTGLGPQLSPESLSGRYEAEGLRSLIAEGREGMPGFSGSLTDGQLDALASYLLTGPDEPSSP